MNKFMNLCLSLLLFSCSSSSGFEPPKSGLALNKTSIETTGEDLVVVYNTGKTPIKINKVSLDNKGVTQNNIEATTNKDSIEDSGTTCNNATLYENQSCNVMLLVGNGEVGNDVVTFDTDSGAQTFNIKINTPLGDLDLQPSNLSKVGDNLFTITNNRNSAITLTSLALSNNGTIDTSSDVSNCFNKTLAPSETCQFHIKGFVGESGTNLISASTANKVYTYTIKTNTPDNDLQLDKTVITESGEHSVNLVNQGDGVMKINYVTFNAQDTFDTADVSDCVGKTLTKNQQCSIIVSTPDKIAGLDQVTAITDIGNYDNNTIKVDSTGAAVLTSDDSANIKTTKSTAVKIFNVGAMPVKLKSVDVKSDATANNRMLKTLAFGTNSDDITVQDSTCLNKTLNGGDVCEIKATAKGGVKLRSTMGFLSTNQYMQTQNVDVNQYTNKNQLEFYDPLSGTKTPTSTIDLTTPTTKTLYVQNSGTNDMNITKVSLSNTTVGNIVSDGCTGKNIYATESCPVTIKVANDAHSKVFMQVDTTQEQPNNKLLLNANNANLTFSNGSDVGTMPTSVQKTFTVVNPNNFDINVSNIIYDNSAYSLDTKPCIGTLHAKASCSMLGTSFTTPQTLKVTLVSDNFATPQVLSIMVNNGVKISYANIGKPLNPSFIITNDNSENGTMTIANNTGGSVIPNGQNPELFTGGTNCMQYGGIIPHNTSCQYILSLPSNDPNTNFGSVGFDFKYAGGGDFAETFTPYVTRHDVKISATYQPNQFINANQPIVNNLCWVKGKMASNEFYQPDGITVAGYILKVGDDGLTPYVIPFLGNKGSCWSAYNRFEELPINTYSTSSRLPLLHIFPPTGIEANFYLDAGGYCNDTTCTLPISIVITGGTNFTTPIVFAKPKPAQNYTVIDGVKWNPQ